MVKKKRAAKRTYKIPSLKEKLSIARWIEDHSAEIKEKRLSRMDALKRINADLGLAWDKKQFYRFLANADLGAVFPKRYNVDNLRPNKPKKSKYISVLSPNETKSLLCQVYLIAKELNVLLGDFTEAHDRVMSMRITKDPKDNAK